MNSPGISPLQAGKAGVEPSLEFLIWQGSGECVIVWSASTLRNQDPGKSYQTFE